MRTTRRASGTAAASPGCTYSGQWRLLLVCGTASTAEPQRHSLNGSKSHKEDEEEGHSQVRLTLTRQWWQCRAASA